MKMLLPLILASGGQVTSDVEPNSGWENLGLILTKPDNVPILIMIVTFTFFTYMALRDGFKHDRLIKEGRKQDILKAMQE
ncbi:MAG TPA: hypothetical protein VFA20_35020 [Myxococcaceae bacterium]|nr:hypothetical protein [Myxococcaceae bacterium]